MNLSDVHAARMVKANNAVRTLSGSEHLIVLRKFSAPADADIDQTWKEVSLKPQRPSVEQTILAKVRALSDAEMASTEFGMIKRGDLFVTVDPDIQVVNFDEMRFLTDSLLDDGTSISNTWDYTVYEVKRTDFSSITVARTFVARRKVEQTPGGVQET